MVLPEPVLSHDDIKVAGQEFHNSPGLISYPWSNDPTKLAVLRAMASCLARLRHGDYFLDVTIVGALAQKLVCFLHYYSLEVEEVH